MAWVKLDDGFPLHPKIVGLSLEARWAYVEALCYAARYQTDGEVPAAVAANGRVREELIASGLWESLDNSVSIHDYLQWNLSKKQAEALSKKRAKAGRKGAAKRWQMPSQRDGTSTGVVEVGGGGVGEGELRRLFERLWVAYPAEGRRAKPTAFERFKTAVRSKGADPEVIIAGAGCYASDPNRDPAHTKWLQGWLSDERWNDPPLPSRSSGSRNPADLAYRRALGGA